jgi:hypothetical protein
MSTNRNTDSVIADISVGDEVSRRIEDISML